MPRTRAIWLTCLTVGALTLPPASAAAAAGTATAEHPHATFYVATDGNDGWSGKLASPNAEQTDGPFATLAKARDALRKLDRRRQTVPLVVMVRGGKYFLPEPMVLDARDSGTLKMPVRYTAYPGEKPVLSGGRPVAGWRPYKGKIVRADIPAGARGKWKFRQLFYHGRRQIRARWPNFDPQHPYAGDWAKMEGPAEPKSEIAFQFNPGDFPRRWAKPAEAEVNFFFGNNWGNDIIPIKSLDLRTRAITLTHGMTCYSKPLAILPYTSAPAWLRDVQDGCLAFHRGQRFFVENVLEELDQPGEWCWDSQEGKLCFWPPDGAPHPSAVVVPVLQGLISLRGASHVVLAGLTFTETNGGDNIFRDGVDGVGAQYPMPGWKYCGEAVHFRAAEGCRIEGNRFVNLGGNAVYLEGECLRNTVCGNEISGVGACGVAMGGAGAQYPMFNEITGNRICHPGALNKFSAGIYLALSEGNVIAHNRIAHVPHHAINLGNAGRSRNIIEFNELRDTCLECSDTGALNCWMEPEPRDGSRQGHIIRYNLIVDSRERGIYLDNYTSNCFVYGNVIVRARTNGITVHAGKNNVIENNIIVGSSHALACYDGIDGLMPAMALFSSGNRFCRNIVCDGGDVIWLSHKRPERAFSQIDYNVIFHVAEAATHLKNWQAKGYEIHSLMTDPMFLDPAHDDYRLKPESPAWKLGFQPIDVARIGPGR